MRCDVRFVLRGITLLLLTGLFSCQTNMGQVDGAAILSTPLSESVTVEYGVDFGTWAGEEMSEGRLNMNLMLGLAVHF